MRRLLWLSCTVFAIALPAQAATGGKAAAKPAATGEVQSVYKDIEATLGVVPGFLKAFPEAALPGAWEEMKHFQMNPNTAIPSKYKELIGLGVAAQIPCHYCIYFHTEVARAQGATDAEIKEAVVTAAQTRRWSTFINGLQYGEENFKSDIDRMISHVQGQSAKEGQAMPAKAAVTNVQEAWRDMEKAYGFVPGFVKALPDEAVVGLWQEMVAIEMNPNGAIPGKYRDLISLGVSAQIPCKSCTYADTAFAMKLDGASDREVHEALTMAAAVRHWSTFLNGIQQDEAQFRRDMDKVLAFAKAKVTRPAGPAEKKAPKSLPLQRNVPSPQLRPGAR